MTRQFSLISTSVTSVEVEVVDQAVTVDPDKLATTVGWVLRPEGLCRGDVCVPVHQGERLWRGDRVDLGIVLEVLGRAVVIDIEAGILAYALDPAERHRALDDLVAPEFSLPDLEGTDHSLSEWSGSKRLLVTFASWCGCRYDLPGWQALHDELAPAGFGVVGVAMDHRADDVVPWVEGISFPVLLDANHLLSELYAISNVPTVIWIDEDGRIVRPNGLPFGTDTFADFTGVRAEPHLDAVREWVLDGIEPLDPAAARRAVGDLSADEIRARLHFRVGAVALRQGNEAAAREHLSRASQLAPHDFTVRRAAMPLVGQDPFGDEFLALYQEWQEAGAPFHGLGAERT
jgi:peroxiredoxin